MKRNGTGNSAYAYETIKKKIIECVYTPGSRLSEADLIATLGVGRSPIRSAMTQLRSEGWVEVSPQSGTYVSQIDQRQMQEVFELRTLLETYVIRLAAKNITDDQLLRLRFSLEQLKASMGNQELKQVLFDELDAFDSHLHFLIYDIGGNKTMASVLTNVYEKTQWLKRSTSPSTPTRIQLWYEELEHIVAALEARDPDQAAQRMQEHIGRAEDFELDHIATKEA